MVQRKQFHVLGWVVLACCVTTLSVNSPLARGDDPAAAKENKDKESKEKGKSRGRLPPFYNKVVDKEQRSAIYKIQEKYGPQIDELTKQLETLEDKRDAEVAAVLTDEQRQKLAALIAESKPKGGEGKKKPAAPAGATASAPEAK